MPYKRYVGIHKLDRKNECNIRSKRGYMPYKRYNEKFKKLIFPHISALWNSLPKNAHCKDLTDFNSSQIKSLNPLDINTFLGGTNKVIHF